MKNYFQTFISLRENTDFEKTISIISEGVSIRGYNLWLLLCSSILASIGIDTNSTAVIIGAMLILPLMSPILGVGLSVGIHDKKLLIRSLRDLSLAVSISFLTSVTYFFLSPLGEPTPELQARTFPTLLDVLIALFGGIAGIVSISRHKETMAIPGVAIATALMPPLCTAGFGIATQHWNYFLGAFYLFFINAVFISLATYAIVKYLHFPTKEFINRKIKKRYNLWFGVITFILLLPSIYFLYTVYKKEIIKEDINTLVLTPIKKSGNEILKWEIVPKDSVFQVKVYYSGNALGDSLKHSIDSTLHIHHLVNYYVAAIRLNLTNKEVSRLSAQMTKQMFDEMHLEELKKQILVNPDTLSYTQVFNEAKVAFPFIDSLYNGWLTIPDAKKNIDTLPFVIYTTKRIPSKTQAKLFYEFLLVRFKKDSFVLIKQK